MSSGAGASIESDCWSIARIASESAEVEPSGVSSTSLVLLVDEVSAREDGVSTREKEVSGREKGESGSEKEE